MVTASVAALPAAQLFLGVTADAHDALITAIRPAPDGTELAATLADGSRARYVADPIWVAVNSLTPGDIIWIRPVH